MNYNNNYYDYVKYVRSLDRKKKHGIYYEKHHIIPKCLGGDDSKENLILLTSREHFLAHFLLCKIYKDSPYFQKVLRAFMCMTYNKKIRYFNSRLFSRLKEENRKFQSENMLGRRIQPNNYKHSDITKQKMSASRKDKKPSLGLRHTVESKEKIKKSISNKIRMYNDTLEKGAFVEKEEIDYYLSYGYRLGNKKTSEDTKNKIKQKLLRRTFKKDHKEKISKALKGKMKSIETIEKIKKSKKLNKKPISQDTRQKLSEASKGRVWMNDTTTNKMIKKEDINYMLSLGWVLGRSDISSPSRKVVDAAIASLKGKAKTKESIQKRLDTMKNNNYRISEKTKTKISIANKGRIRITKGTDEKCIYPIDLDYWISLGWVRGRRKKL